MPLILAVDRDRRQASQLVSLVHKRLKAELVQASSAAEGLEALAGRVPDLILTSSLLSPKDDGVLAGHLRELGHLAAHVQTLTIPVLKSSRPRRSTSGVLSKLRRDNAKASSAPEGCDPEVFAEQIEGYLSRAAEERQLRATREEKASVPVLSDELPPSFIEAADFVQEPEAIIDDLAPLAQPLDLASDEPRHLVSESIEAVVEDPTIASESTEVVVEATAEGNSPTAVVVAGGLHPSTSAGGALSQIEGQASGPDEPAAEIPGFEGATLPVFEATDSGVAEEASPALAEATPTQDRGEAADVRAIEDEEPAIAVPIEQLVALFADFEPRSIEASAEPVIIPSMEPAHDETPMVGSADIPEPEVLSATTEPTEPVEVVSTAHSMSAQSPAVITPPLPEPVLDEEALVQIGEAAWKARFRAAFLKELGIGSRRDAPTPVAPAETKGTEFDLPRQVEALEPTEEPKPHEAAPEAIAECTAEATSSAPEEIQTPRKENRSKKKAKGKTKGPIQDEWGLFDPEQCGFSALVDKLEEVTDSPEEQPQRGTRVRVISY